MCVVTSDAALAERAAAEAFEAGASGLWERGDGRTLEVYAPTAQAPAVHAALVRVGADGGLEVTEPVLVEERDWSTAWRDGLEAIRVSPRLVVRPPFVDPCEDSPAELVIEPAQAFGTGAHGSTRLALELLDAALERVPGAAVLDVGTGSGILALAALGLGARTALGCDLDPLAAPAALRNARRNGLHVALRLFTGTTDALGGEEGAFDLVIANMIRSELEPCLPSLVRNLSAAGVLILSGLLLSERDLLQQRLADEGLAITDARDERDERGDHWLAIEAQRT